MKQNKIQIYLPIKRFFDFIVSLITFILLLPIFFLVCCLLAFYNSGSVFFIQRRPGLKGKIFKIIKFKTMNDKRDSHGELLPDMERITPFGTFIRKYSLDEIPQLINVIIGQMSLVGPRPLREEYLEYYSEEQMRRHDAKPGVTGWAQVNGRNTISWEQKFAHDLYYVDHIGLFLDLRILALTVKKILFPRDVNTDENETMSFFRGSNEEGS
ncbi:sugar transferase [Flagellimonas allohymeniacidonis]|uniref:Sugar transferase n=1 Tax=Flagellimonas allohymeniacidonis TaxID=2517819 RepID=A0A4Q8QK07_9FLAO|nr:sugar transferase [Allomuricauda hymeniacidonis]TAI48566.1 sugar transferase [Allomuricauda hymeniacidonis]